jgi:hypothetical protein
MNGKWQFRGPLFNAAANNRTGPIWTDGGVLTQQQENRGWHCLRQGYFLAKAGARQGVPNKGGLASSCRRAPGRHNGPMRRSNHGARVAAILTAVIGAGHARQADAWGDKGHEMTARVAVRSLPPEMPAFFRKADVELAYLCQEPDRWRDGKREPALNGLVGNDHAFRLEDTILPLPPNRFEFVVGQLGKLRVEGGPRQLRDLRFAPYAVAEHAEMLMVNFMLWRKAPDRTPIERRKKRQIEQNIIYVAGTLGHFVTDIAMPLHTTIHYDGWNPAAPNPKGYEGKGVHMRFEETYVNHAIEEKDFATMVPAVRPRGPWLEAALEHIREAHEQVERIYVLDKASPFGEGHETPEAKTFTCERLAHGAAALRDFWYTAWVKSEIADSPSP